MKKNTINSADFSKKFKEKLISIAVKVYDKYNEYWVVLFIFVPVLVLLNSNYIKLYLSREILGIFLSALITIITVFSAIIIAFIEKDTILKLWNGSFKNYIKYTVSIIIVDSILLVFHSNLLDQWHLVEIFTFPLLLLNIYPVVLMIRATEDYISSVN